MYGWSGLGIARVGNPTQSTFVGRAQVEGLDRGGVGLPFERTLVADDFSAYLPAFDPSLAARASHGAIVDVRPPVDDSLYLLGQKVGPQVQTVVNSSGPNASTPGATAPVVDAGFSLSDIPWWAWLGVAGVGAYALKGKGKR